MAIKETVLPMTKDLWPLRRRVIDLLYEAREIIDMPLPRLKIRIVTYDKQNTMGLCHIGRNHITISVKCVDWTEQQMRKTVWHELGHAYFGAKHDVNCPLMRQGWKDLATTEQLAAVLKKLAEKHKQKK